MISKKSEFWGRKYATDLHGGIYISTPQKDGTKVKKNFPCIYNIYIYLFDVRIQKVFKEAEVCIHNERNNLLRLNHLSNNVLFTVES